MLMVEMPETTTLKKSYFLLTNKTYGTQNSSISWSNSIFMANEVNSDVADALAPHSVQSD